MMNNSAIQAVVSAYTTPEVWCGDDNHDAQVVFANGVYTVGSNGDVQDYTDSDEAIVALAREWDKEDQYRLSKDAV